MTVHDSPRDHSGHRFFRELSLIGIFALAYFLAHLVAFFFPDAEAAIMAVWSAAGIGLAAFLLSPHRHWPALILAFYVAGVTADVFFAKRPFFASVGYMTANMVESLGCAWLILRWGGGSGRFDRVAEVVALIGGAVVVNAASACIGAGAAVLGRGATFGNAWFSWYVADGLGVLLVTPLITTWAWSVRAPSAERQWWATECAVCVAFWCAAVWVTFLPAGPSDPLAPQPYLLLAVLVWPALRLGQRVVALVLVLLFVLALVDLHTHAGASPLSGATLTDQLLSFQIFLASVACMGFVLSASQATFQRIEKTLRDSEQRLAWAVEQARLAHWEMDGATRIFTFNDQFYALYATTAEREGGYRMSAEVYAREFLLPEERHIVSHDVAQLLAGEVDDLQKEHRIRRRDGEIRHIVVRITPIRDGAGRVLGTRGSNQDITERKRAEAALKDTKLLLEQVLEQSPIPIALVSMPDAVVRVVNPACRRFLGIDDEPSLIGTPLMDIKASWQDFDAQGTPGTVADLPLARSLMGVTTKGEERRVVRKDGTVRYELVSGNPIIDDAGEVIAGYLTMMDITARKRAEEDLRASKDQLSNALEMAHLGHWEYDVANDVFTFNDQFYKIFHTTVEQVGGYALTSAEYARRFVHPDDMDMVGEETRKAIEATDPHFARQVEHRMLYADGTVGHVAVRFCIVKDAHGRTVKTYGVNQDITESKRAEEAKAKLEGQLQQAQKMESVGRLAGGVAHDFNNMLGVILGHTELALEQVDLAQPLHADLEEIRKAAARSADLTRQLLAFARKQTIAPKVLDLNETITSMLTMLRRLIGEDIHLVWQPCADLWPVLMDSSQIDQILANLCVNARDAIAGVGKLTIETTYATFDEAYCAMHAGYEPGDYVRLTVSDDGCGMDPETVSHLFEPFFTTKDVGQGTGLGLATVYGIVKQNHGFIDVYSELAHGTAFTIYLPRHVGKTEPVQTDASLEPAKRGHETILLVEDEPAILTLTTRMLERQGYTVLAAHTPGEAVRIAREYVGEIHLVMTDVVMPEMNGRDLARNLLSMYPHLGRLFMSGYTSDVIAHHGVLDDGVCFIQKPFSTKDLAAKVREALDRE